MVREENARQGFLTDQQYAKLRDVLPDYLRGPLFVVAYFTGVRLGEPLAWTWPTRSISGRGLLRSAPKRRRADTCAGGADHWRGHAHLAGESGPAIMRTVRNYVVPPCRVLRIKHFRAAWTTACQSAEVPDLKFHDLRRTARPQHAPRRQASAQGRSWMRIALFGHRTDSMERRYNIVDIEGHPLRRKIYDGAEEMR